MRADKQAVVQGMRPTLVTWLLMGALAIASAGCGSSRGQVMLTAGAVRAAFASEGFRPNFVFDSRTATVASINRLYPPGGDVAQRTVNAFARQVLEGEVVRSSLYPVTTLGFSTDDGGIEVNVFGRLIDAYPALMHERSRAAFEKLRFPPYNVRIANVVVGAGTLPGRSAKRLLAAEAELRSVAAQH